LPLNSDNFYRIEFVRPNGSVFYSEILPVSLKNVKPKELIVSPNPFSSHVNFSIKLEKSKKIQYRLLSIDSRIFASGEKTGQAGNNTFTIDNLSAIPDGTYLLQTIIDNQTYHKVIIKSR
jgi:hypothetical protein